MYLSDHQQKKKVITWNGNIKYSTIQSEHNWVFEIFWKHKIKFKINWGFDAEFVENPPTSTDTPMQMIAANHLININASC